MWRWLPVVLAVCLAMLQASKLSELHQRQIYDAEHYINCGRLFLQSTADPQALATSLRLNGPVMPLLSSFAAICGGLSSDGSLVLTPFVSIMVFSFAVNVLLVTVITAWLCKKKLWGLIAGVIYAVYLPAQASATLFCSETPSATLLLAAVFAPVMVLSAVRLRKYGRAQIASAIFGVLLASIAMIKTALVPGLLILLLVYILALPGGARRSLLISGTCGAALVCLTYAFTMFALCGRLELMPSRDPSMNMAVGCDYEVEAWECKPMPFITYQGTFQKPLITLAQTIMSNPGEFWRLTASKFLRAWDRPWLSCGAVPFDIPRQLARIQHGLLVGFAVIALCVTARSIKIKRFLTSRNLALFGLIVLTLGHFIYVLFESQARYMYTAMPLVIVLACVGLARSRAGRLSVYCSIALLIACILCLTSGQEGAITTHESKVRGGTLQLISAEEDFEGQPYLIFCARDFDKRWPLTVQINQNKYKKTAMPLIEASQFMYKPVVEDMEATICRARGFSVPSKLWNWYAIPLNSQEIPLRATSITFGVDNDFYGQDSVLSAGGVITLPALYYRSLSHLESSCDGLESRPPVQFKLGHAGGDQSSKRVPLIFYAKRDARFAHNICWKVYRARSAEFVCGQEIKENPDGR